MFILDTLAPYDELDRKGIQYTVCRDFDHISRYRSLRQVVHCPDDSEDRFMALEVPNEITESDIEFTFHEVLPKEENRLDVIAYNSLGSASYAWTIAYFNRIVDGCTARPGQMLRIPKNIASLMTSGNIMQSVPALQLNLGYEE